MIETANENPELSPYYRQAEAQYEIELAIVKCNSSDGDKQDVKRVVKLLEAPSALHLNWDALAKIPTTPEIAQLVAYHSPNKVSWASLFSKMPETVRKSGISQANVNKVLVASAFAHENFEPLTVVNGDMETIQMALGYYDRMTYIYKKYLVEVALPKLIQLDDEGDAKFTIDFLVEVLKNEARYDSQMTEFLEESLFPAACTVIEKVGEFRINFSCYLKIGQLAKKLWYAREFTLSEVKEHIVALYSPKLSWDPTESIAALAKLTKLNQSRLKDLKLLAIQKAAK